MKPAVRQLLFSGRTRFNPNAPISSLTASTVGSTLPAGWTFTVDAIGGSRYFFDSTGDYRAATASELRHQYASSAVGGSGSYEGILLEPWSVNVIRNGGGVGASGTTLPTNWTDNSASIALTLVSASSGTENGIKYSELRYTGTPTGTALTILHDASGAITSYTNASNGTTSIASGQTWTASAYTKVVSNTGVSAIDIGLVEAGSAVTTYGRLPREAVYRKGHSTVTLTSGVTSIYAQTRLTVAVGVAVDITIKIAHVQLEPLGYASSSIPTIGSSLTRAGDLISRSMAGVFPANKRGTFYFEHIEPYKITDGTQRTMMRFINSTLNGRMSIEATNNNCQLIVVNWNGASATTEAILNTNNPIQGRIVKQAVRFGPGDVAIVRDNFAVKTDTVVNFFTFNDPANLVIGVSRPLIFRQFSLYAGRATNDQLQALTENFDNFTFVDRFQRPDSVSLGTAPDGKVWDQYGVGERDGVVEASLLNSWVVTEDQPLEADTASYSGIDFGTSPKRMAAVFRIDPTLSPSGTPLGGNITLVAMPGTFSVAEILDASVHITLTGRDCQAGYFSASTLTKQTVIYSADLSPDGSTKYYAGWEILDGEMWIEYPDGQATKTVSPEVFSPYLGRYITYEAFWIPGQHRPAIKVALAA